jgi:hypothetical protein
LIGARRKSSYGEDENRTEIAREDGLDFEIVGKSKTSTQDEFFKNLSAKREEPKQ